MKCEQIHTRSASRQDSYLNPICRVSHGKGNNSEGFVDLKKIKNSQQEGSPFRWEIFLPLLPYFVSDEVWQVLYKPLMLLLASYELCEIVSLCWCEQCEPLVLMSTLRLVTSYGVVSSLWAASGVINIVWISSTEQCEKRYEVHCVTCWRCEHLMNH